jgi:thioredoxin 1
MENNEVIHCNEASFEKLIKSADRPVLVDFWAPWCGPCRALGPLLEKLAKEHGSEVVIAKVNVDEDQMLAARFNISAIPTMIIFKGGAKVAQIAGLVGYEALVAKVKSVQ